MIGRDPIGWPAAGVGLFAPAQSKLTILKNMFSLKI